MRIIGGTYRGKKLYSPDSNEVRPTSDRAREAVFNILNSRIHDDWDSYAMLDVFAGTGAMGLEALSRGVSSVTFIDLKPQIVKRNAALFQKEQSKIRIMTADASKLAASPQKYNLVFIDAPYKKGLSSATLKELSNKGWLAPHALCLVEIEKTESLEVPDGFEFIDERRYGLSKVIFLSYQTVSL